MIMNISVLLLGLTENGGFILLSILSYGSFSGLEVVVCSVSQLPNLVWLSLILSSGLLVAYLSMCLPHVIYPVGYFICGVSGPIFGNFTSGLVVLVAVYPLYPTLEANALVILMYLYVTCTITANFSTLWGIEYTLIVAYVLLSPVSLDNFSSFTNISCSLLLVTHVYAYLHNNYFSILFGVNIFHSSIPSSIALLMLNSNLFQPPRESGGTEATIGVS